MFGDSVKRVAWLRLAFRERSNAMAYNDFSAPIWKSDRTLAEMLERSQAMRDRYATLPEDSTPPAHRQNDVRSR
jgi:hypothetical protein